MDIQKLKDLHKEGKNDSEIAKCLNEKRQTIQWQRKKLGLKSNFSYKSFRKMNYDEVEKLIKKNKTDKEIADIFGVKQISVYGFRTRYNIERDNLSINKSIFITDKQLSILTGTLLGDSSLRLSSINPYFSCEHGIKQYEYNKWKHEELLSLESKFKTYKRKTIDLRTNIFYESNLCRTPANPEFLQLYHNLYHNNKKVITEEFLKNFNELSLAVLYMDDGSRNANIIKIYTNCFSNKDLEIFTKFLKDKFSLEFKIYKDHSLCLPAKQYQVFEDIVKPYIHKSMLYKLKGHVIP